MRAKQILNVVPFRTKVRLVYERFTVTPVATAFVFVALAHCIVQISLQAVAYSANTAAGRTVSEILETNGSFAFVVVVGERLLTCTDPADKASCTPVVSVPVANDSSSAALPGPLGGMHLAAITTTFRRDIDLSDLSFQCIQALNWPNMILTDARLEDVCFLVSQIWLLGISIVTILNESMPHLLTALFTHALSSIWSAFQVSRTQRYSTLYRALVVRDACGGINVLDGFWGKRLDYFLPILVLNSVAFAVTSFVSYKLFKVYAVQTFKRIGYLDRMNVLYSYILTFSVALQLSAFVIICAAALQLDALFNGFLARSLVNKTVYRILFIHVCVWTLPWICIGWTSFRRENRLWSNVFFLVGFAMLGIWISVFPTPTYERRFQGSPFFAAITVTSFIVLTVTLVLGALCRLNFGRGLPQYLRNQDLIDEPVFVPVILIRKRRISSSSLSIASSDKHRSGFSSHSQDEKSTSESAIRSGRPPSYSLEAHGVKTPEPIFLTKSERNLPRKQLGRRTFLHLSANSVVGRIDLKVIQEEARSTGKSSSVVLSPKPALARQLKDSSPDKSLLNVSRGIPGGITLTEPISPSRTRTSLHPCSGHSESSRTPILSPCLDMRGSDASISCSHRGLPFASLNTNISPSQSSVIPVQIQSSNTTFAPQRSLSLSSHSSLSAASQHGRIGLPSNPKCFK